jgi:YbgC/YbaW family acyl-CoA thioester hydrolase
VKTYCRLFYRIPFSETDAMKIVHHTNHARYLERGRIEFLRLVGLDYVDIMKRGMHFPVTELTVEYKKPLVFDEIIMIETSISMLTRVRLNFAYKVFPVPELAPPSLSTEPFQGKPSFLGETFHCCVNDEGRPIEAASDVQARMQSLFGGV